MVSAYLADALRDPTSELKDLFTRHSASSDFPKEVAAHFSKVFSTDSAFAEIATLNVQHPPTSYPDRSLVRFRAMVQDTSPGSEMYLRKTSTGSIGGWGIHEEMLEDASHTIDYADLRECNVLWAVSVPGETQWSTAELDGSTESASDDVYDAPKPYKYPSSAAHVGVQVKLYDTSVAEKLKPTDLATFVGILTKEPLNLDAESSSEVPTLHVLFVRAHDGYTLLSRPYSQSSTSILPLRNEMLDWIAEEALGGDRDAAEWILLASIAKVQSRNPPLLPPSLTLSHFPTPPIPSPPPSDSPDASPPPVCTPILSHILKQLLPLSEMLPLSLPFLNRVPFCPESQDEDLHSGALQLAKGTVLLVTESGVREGKLVERGLNNINALQEVMASQTLGYVFPFSRFSFPTDIACLVLSEGSKSTFFKTDLNVPLRPASSDATDISKLYKPADQVALPEPEKLAQFRDLIIGARSGKVRVTEAVSEHIQHEFVRDRQQNVAVTSDDLIRRMTIAKLYALSLHEEELSIDAWERAKAFDERRKTRLIGNTNDSS